MDSLPGVLDRLKLPYARIEVQRAESIEDCRLGLLECNDSFSEQTGVDPMIGRAYPEIAFRPNDWAALKEHVTASTTDCHTFSLYFAPTRRRFTVTSRTVDEVLEMVLVDITNYYNESAFSQLREQAYRSFIEHLPMIAFLRIVKPEPVPLFTAGSFREITGYGPEQGASSDRWLELVHPDDLGRVSSEAELLYGEGDYEQELEYRIVRVDGKVRWVRSYDKQFTSDDGSMRIVQGLILDVTEQKEHEQALERANEQIQEQNRMLARLARTDPLTGLLNRRAMQEQLEREIRMISRGRRVFSVMLLDLDHFKAVNDKHGHRAGDRVLLTLAETLSEQVRASDIQARWGGEEFMVLFSGTRIDDALPVAEKLLSWFSSHPTMIEHLEIRVTFTGGLVEAQDGDTVDTLFGRADKALYQGKHEGRNQIKVLGPTQP